MTLFRNRQECERYQCADLQVDILISLIEKLIFNMRVAYLIASMKRITFIQGFIRKNFNIKVSQYRTLVSKFFTVKT
ncbi:hypothetical protein V1478_010102 [Vespula squamosa]|uniref:Uncharacterized protein n=1 Tax=Vespula squamosa TaxID=30214 RepID=A0ABD2AIS4_VESSQ